MCYTVSFASIIFSGPLAEYRDLGVGIGLLSGAIYALCGAMLGPLSSTSWWGNQSVPVVVMALAVGALAVELGGSEPGTLLSSALLLIAGSTALAGVLLTLVGVVRIGQMARFIPYPVTGGFLAATGVFLLWRSIGLVAPEITDLASLVTAGSVMNWAPIVASGIAMVWLARRVTPVFLIFFVVLVYLAGFFGYLGVTGISLEDAAVQGWFLAPGDRSPSLFPPLSPDRFGGADLDAVGAQLPLTITLMTLALLGTLLNITSIEEITGRPSDLNRGLRNVGLANLVGGAIGGFVGHHSASMMHLLQNIHPLPSRMIGLAGSALFTAVLLFGGQVIGYVPIGVVALVLSYIAASMIWDWLIVSARRMPRADYAIVWLILLSAVLFDFVTAIVVGLVAASVMFTIAYSRLDAVRTIVTGRVRRSNIERGQAEAELLSERGDETLIVELQGYLFFGTANALFDRLAARLESGPAVVETLIVDVRRVTGMDVSAANMLAKLRRLVEERGAVLVLAGVGEGLEARLASVAGLEGVVRAQSLAAALADIEDRHLSEAEVAPIQGGFRALFDEADAAGVALDDGITAVPAGTVLLEQGGPSDSLVLLEEGRLVAEIGNGGASVQVARFLPGAVVGEIGFTTGTPRTATIRAEVDCRVRTISHCHLERLAAEHPGLAIRFHELLAALLARRLGRTTALVHAIDG